MNLHYLKGISVILCMTYDNIVIISNVIIIIIIEHFKSKYLCRIY